jgi:hypothetical protein
MQTLSGFFLPYLEAAGNQRRFGQKLAKTLVVRSPLQSALGVPAPTRRDRRLRNLTIFAQNACSRFGKQKTCVRAVFAAAGLSVFNVTISSNLDFNVNAAGQFQFHQRVNSFGT